MKLFYIMAKTKFIRPPIFCLKKKIRIYIHFEFKNWQVTIFFKCVTIQYFDILKLHSFKARKLKHSKINTER